jgi:hypothetical protein
LRLDAGAPFVGNTKIVPALNYHIKCVNPIRKSTS